MTETIGILLAGGLSRRFGSPKVFAEIDGELFYEKVYRALAAACDHVVIVSREEFLPLFPAEFDAITDLTFLAGKGPLAGICSAMALRPADRYIVLPCDMPFIGPQEALALKRLSTEADVTAVQTEDEKIPLFSVWNGNWAEELKRYIESGDLSVFGFLSHLKIEWIESSLIHKDKNVFRNINTIII